MNSFNFPLLKFLFSSMNRLTKYMIPTKNANSNKYPLNILIKVPNKKNEKKYTIKPNGKNADNVISIHPWTLILSVLFLPL